MKTTVGTLLSELRLGGWVCVPIFGCTKLAYVQKGTLAGMLRVMSPDTPAVYEIYHPANTGHYDNPRRTVVVRAIYE